MIQFDYETFIQVIIITAKTIEFDESTYVFQMYSTDTQGFHRL